MDFPDFMRAFPAIDIPLPEDVVSTNVLRSDAGIVVFFTVHQDCEIPAHAHLGQWGTLVAGEIELTIDGETRTRKPGDSWNIPAGVEHSARLKAGARIIDVFEEPDRYPLKPVAMG
ncbi:cupin [Brevirhabdus pacifica]|uniref:Cupin n=1 Tax=Brevirhabdus pacifica TaxID=1267768 RepID=A0A1U7DGH2_9RHOB|nr:cupin domain-containing protein [Brevirhabdus pacifica]APX89100.1 cupin [Brevirhabdus pacifica]OWU76840.1 cupin [Loktanella sp. 22II-4b]PJJ86318.1 Cupin domain-containing protein [Brevirhabdus pacifica]